MAVSIVVIPSVWLSSLHGFPPASSASEGKCANSLEITSPPFRPPPDLDQAQTQLT